MIKKYRKRSIEVEAVLFNDTKESIEDILKLDKNQSITFYKNKLYIKTLEGEMLISKGDYVIKGVRGELYPCKPDIFKQTYYVENNNEIYGKGIFW